MAPITFVSQSVSLLVLPFWLRLAVSVLWHCRLPDPRGCPDWPPLSFFLCPEVCLCRHFWLHCPEIQTWVGVLSWVWKGQVVLIHLLSHLFFAGCSLRQLLLHFFSFLGHCWYCPGWSDQKWSPKRAQNNSININSLNIKICTGMNYFESIIEDREFQGF